MNDGARGYLGSGAAEARGGAGGPGQDPVTGRNPRASPASPPSPRGPGGVRAAAPLPAPPGAVPLTPGGQAGGLGQRARTRTFQDLISTKTLLQPELGRGTSLGRPRRFSRGCLQGPPRLRERSRAPSPAHQRPREPEPGTSGRLLLSEGWCLGSPEAQNIRQLLPGNPSLSFAPGKSRRMREAPGGHFLGSLLQR